MWMMAVAQFPLVSAKKNAAPLGPRRRDSVASPATESHLPNQEALGLR
jgi:hypothetical protein